MKEEILYNFCKIMVNEFKISVNISFTHKLITIKMKNKEIILTTIPNHKKPFNYYEVDYLDALCRLRMVVRDIVNNVNVINVISIYYQI